MTDTKRRVQTRLEDGVYERLMAIGNVLGMNTDTDIIRYALTDFVRNHLDVLEKHADIYRPLYLEQETWYKVAEAKYGMWKLEKSAVHIALFEVNSMHEVIISETVLPLTLQEVVEKFNDADYDEKMDSNGHVKWDVEEEPLDPERSELEILRIMGMAYGKEVFSRTNLDQYQIREIAKDYNLEQLAWV